MPDRAERNTLLTSLAAFCGSHPVDEKILLVPSMAVGVEILDALARSGCAHANLRPATIFSLAHGIAGPVLSREGKRLLSRAQLLAVVETACDEVLNETSYFGALRRSVGLHRALYRTLDELRRARVTPGALARTHFEDLRKARELSELSRSYEASLARLGATDAAEILQRATALCAAGGPRPLPASVLRPEGLDLTPAEEAFLEACARDVVVLAADLEATTASARLAFTHALGEENEVRGVFRRILDEHLKYDDVEIVFDDDATFRPLLYELSSQYAIPCTFGGGIPVTYTRPGQGILDVLEWLGRDFQAASLERLLADGRADLSTFQPSSGRVGGLRVARLLRGTRIFSGAARYASRLNALVERERVAIAAAADDETRAVRAERLVAAETLRAFVSRLLAVVPAPANGNLSLPALARSLADGVLPLLSRASALDGAAAAGLRDLFLQLGDLPERLLTPAEAALRLSEAVKDLAVSSSGPAPGALHITRLERAGYCGRSQTFVVGMDEARFPGTPRQDPVLLDSEREALNRVMPDAHLALPGRMRAEDRIAKLRALLARVRGRVTLSFSNRDIVQDGERFPSPVLLDLYRAREGNAADWDDFTRALPDAATFVPSGLPLDEVDWWLARVKETPAAAGLFRQVELAYPWLAAGARAEAERASPAFTAWDGRLTVEPGALDPRVTREPLSASRLEKLAKCPKAYFFEYVLGLSEPDEDRPESAWLNAREFGNLLHETLYEFMAGLRADGQRLDSVRDAARLRAVAARRIARWRELVPPPNAAALKAQENEILAACDIFLRAEAANAAATPLYFEVPFGLKRASRDEPLGSPRPVEIAIPGGTFLLQGQIDRIDETKPGHFAVWDYKSGGDFNFPEEERAARPLHGGRLLQHALYRRAAMRLLSDAGVADPTVTSGYFLTTRKGRMQRFVLDASPEDLDATLADLFALLASGTFPHAADPADCNFCPFREICGDVQRSAANAAAKLEYDPRLEPIRSIGRRGV